LLAIADSLYTRFMKHFAIVGIAVCPLIAGCAGHAVDAGVVPQMAQQHDHAISDLRGDLRSLRRQVRILKKQIASRNSRAHVTHVSTARASDSELQDKLEQRLALLGSKIEQLAIAQKQTTTNHNELADGRDDDRTLVIGQFKRLEAKLQQLDEAQKAQAEQKSAPAIPRPQTDPQRIVKLEALQKKYSARIKKLEQGLEKDRSLVIDYLEDIDKRLSDIEARAKPPAPSAPPPKP
jgi:hypothetical protein